MVVINYTALSKIHGPIGGITWRIEEVIEVILTSFIIPFIFGGNILVIAAVARYKRLQLPANYFLVSLACADISIGLCIPLSIARQVHSSRIQSEFLCLAPHCLTMTFAAASILSLSCIALDRYLAITKSFTYLQVMTVRRIHLMLIASWLYAIIVAWSPFYNFYDHINHPNTRCTFHLIHKGSLAMLISGIFLPPYLVIFFCYFHIIRIARRHRRAIDSQEHSVQKRLQMRCLAKDTKYAKTVGIVIGLFLILWLPYQMSIVVDVLTETNVPEWVTNYLALLSYVNSVVNPWIYAYKNTEFRLAFKQLLKPLLSRSVSDVMLEENQYFQHVTAFSQSNAFLSDHATIFSLHAQEGFNPADMVSILSRSDSDQLPPGALYRKGTRVFLEQMQLSDVLKKQAEKIDEVIQSPDWKLPPVVQHEAPAGRRNSVVNSNQQRMATIREHSEEVDRPDSMNLDIPKRLARSNQSSGITEIEI